MPIKKIVSITGRNGEFSLLRGLRKFNWEINAVVAMTDDGEKVGRAIIEIFEKLKSKFQKLKIKNKSKN